MSVAARLEARRRRRWALPGSPWDRFAKLMRFVLPLAAAAILIAGLTWPLLQEREFSFILSKDEVDMAGDRMRLGAAVYRGQDDEGRPFVIRAGRGLQQSSADPRVVLTDLEAELQMREGLAEVIAPRGVYDLEDETLFVDGPVVVRRADGYRLSTFDVMVDVPARTVIGEGRVEGSHPLGSFAGDQLTARLDERTVVLEGNTHMRIDP
jgi:lipopolysaccharide export system protein LptC